MECSGPRAGVKLQLSPPPTVAFVTGNEDWRLCELQMFKETGFPLFNGSGRRGYRPLSESLWWIEVSPGRDLRPRENPKKDGPPSPLRLPEGRPSEDGAGVGCGGWAAQSPHALPPRSPRPSPQGRRAQSFKWFLWFRGGEEGKEKSVTAPQFQATATPTPLGCLPPSLRPPSLHLIGEPGHVGVQ